MNVITEELKFADLFPKEAGKVAQRLHIKKDEIPFVRKSYISEKSEVKPKERAVISYISTLAKDRDGEQLLPEGVQLDNYRNNPIVLFGHDYKSMPVGKNLWIKQDEKGLIAKTVFANNERGEELFKAYSEDIGGTGPLLAGFSVGFIPIEWEDTETKELEKNKDLPKRIYKQWELLEYSLVPIPSCPSALTLAVEKNLIPESMKKALDKYIEVEDFQVEVEIENESKTMTPDELKEFYRKQSEPEIEIIGEEEEVEIEVITKPETTDNYHRIPISSGHDGHEIRTIVVSAKKGIKALYCVTCKKIKTYLFDTSKWSMEEAQAWVADHKGLLDRFEEREMRRDEEDVDLQEAVNDCFEMGIEDIEDLTFDDIEEEIAVIGDGAKGAEIPQGKITFENEEMLTEIRQLRADIAELKEGRVLSTKNRTLVKDIRDMIRELDGKLTELLDATEPPEKAERFSCECIKCGYKVTSEEHCKDIECPKCGGEMRRAERPGPGKEAEVEVVKDVDVNGAVKRALENKLNPENFQKAVDLAIKKLQGKVE